MISGWELQWKTTENWNIVYEEDFTTMLQASVLQSGNVKNKL